MRVRSVADPHGGGRVGPAGVRPYPPKSIAAAGIELHPHEADPAANGGDAYSTGAARPLARPWVHQRVSG